MHHPTTSATDDGSQLFAHYAKQAHERLVEIGCKVGRTAKPEQIVTTYFAVKRRLVAKRPRRIFIAKSVIVPAEHEASFREILRRAEVGEDLTPYQSRRLLLYPNKDDALLSDWGIQHLHFDAGTDPKNRSEKLLFARITDDAFYCVEISDHRGFTRQAMLEILDREWPESIARFLLRGGIVGESVTDEQVENLRAANINVFVRLPNGRAYVSPGGGRTSSGENALDIRQCALLRSQCREAAKATAIDGLHRFGYLPPLK